MICLKKIVIIFCIFVPINPNNLKNKKIDSWDFYSASVNPIAIAFLELMIIV